MPQARDNHWLVTYTGKQFWPLDPRPEDICIEDIAHALSNICRFGGHCRQFYSVAQHSVLVSMACTDSLWGLHHDDSEAYLGDIVRPLKKIPQFRQFYEVAEARMMLQICLKLGLDPIQPSNVKLADDIVLATEKRDLLTRHDFKWTEVHIRQDVEPLDWRILPMSPKEAEEAFLERHYDLCPKNAASSSSVQ